MRLVAWVTHKSWGWMVFVGVLYRLLTWLALATKDGSEGDLAWTKLRRRSSGMTHLNPHRVEAGHALTQSGSQRYLTAHITRYRSPGDDLGLGGIDGYRGVGTTEPDAPNPSGNAQASAGE